MYLLVHLNKYERLKQFSSRNWECEKLPFESGKKLMVIILWFSLFGTKFDELRIHSHIYFSVIVFSFCVETI